MVESSAYIAIDALFRIKDKSFVKIENKSVPKQLLCGTPQLITLISVKTPLKYTVFSICKVTIDPERQLPFLNGICHGMSVVAVAHATGQ